MLEAETLREEETLTITLHTVVVLAALVFLFLATAGVSWPRWNSFYAGLFFVAVVLLGVA